MLDMSQEDVIKTPPAPRPLSDSEKLEVRGIQLRLANIATGRLRIRVDSEELEKAEAKAVEKYTQFLDRFSSEKGKYGLDYDTLDWVPLEGKE